MARTILVKDAVHRASVLLQDVNPQFVKYPEREIVNWFNDGQRAIAKYLPMANSRIDAVKLVPGTRQYIGTILAANILPGDGSAAVDTYGNVLIDVVRNMGANGATPGQSIRIVAREVMDSQNWSWHTITGTGTVEQFIYDPRNPKYFYVSPGVPASPAVWVEMSFLADPFPIANTGTPGSELYKLGGANTDVIGIDDKYLDDLINYVVARSFMKPGEAFANPAEAARYTQFFLSSLNAQMQVITGQNPNLQVLPLTPEIPAASK